MEHSLTKPLLSLSLRPGEKRQLSVMQEPVWARARSSEKVLPGALGRSFADSLFWVCGGCGWCVATSALHLLPAPKKVLWDGWGEMCPYITRLPRGAVGCEGSAATWGFLLSLQAQLLPFGCSPGCL